MLSRLTLSKVLLYAPKNSLRWSFRHHRNDITGEKINRWQAIFDSEPAVRHRARLRGAPVSDWPCEWKWDGQWVMVIALRSGGAGERPHSAIRARHSAQSIGMPEGGWIWSTCVA